MEVLQMSNRISELRIMNNRRRRRQQLRRNCAMLVLTTLLILGASTVCFGLKAKAQDAGRTISCKYYKSLAIERGDTLWDIACEYADEEFYDSLSRYGEEVIQINHLCDETIIAGQHLRIPYYTPGS